MKGKTGHGPIGIVLAISLIATGCSSGSDKVSAEVVTPTAANETSPPPKPNPPQPPVAKRVTDRKGNTAGQVIVMEWHHIKSGKGDMFRTPEQFRKDLETLYKMGFRPVTVSEYLANEMNLPPGASPAVMTFDDSNPSQFQLLPDGTVDPKSGVGIWLEFAKTHPDFPVKATWYVLPDVMWGQPKFVDKKVQMLGEWGSELGSHTVTHRQLKKLSDEEVKKEFAGAIDALEKWGEKSPVSLALPFGIAPKNRALLEKFTYKGKEYSMKAAMLVGANPAPSPTSEKLDRYRIPRIQAYPGEAGSDYWLGQIAKGNVKVYVEP